MSSYKFTIKMTFPPSFMTTDTLYTSIPDDPEVLEWMLKIHIGLLFASLVLIITSNLIVLLVFHFNKSLQDVTGIFIQSLAWADLGVGLSCIFSIHSWFHKGWPYEPWFCTFTGFTLSVVIIVSILSLFLVSIDRYVAVTRPLTYHSILTQRRGYMCVIFVWIFSCAIFIPTLLEKDAYWYNPYTFECSFKWEEQSLFSSLLIGLIVLPIFAVSGYCYYHILKTCWVHQREIRRVSSYFQGERSRESTTISHEGHLAKMFLVVVSGYYITWFPLLIVKVLKGFSEAEIPPSVYFFSQWLGEFNSFINCIVYSIGHESFRRCFKRMVLAGWTEVAKKFWHKDQRKRDHKRRMQHSLGTLTDTTESKV